MKKVVKIAASTVSSLGLIGGFAGIVGAAPSIGTTGPDSHNAVKSDSSWMQTVDNKNNVGVNSTNSQNAYSGDVDAQHNTTAGDAESGATSNSNALSASLSLSNNTAGMGSSGSTSEADGSITNT